MQINAIANYNQPSYKGYLPKSTQIEINSLVKQKCHAIERQANRNKETVNVETLTNVIAQGKRIIDKMQQFLQTTHKDTNITVVNKHHLTDNGYDTYLQINNPVIEAKIPIYPEYNEKTPVLTEVYRDGYFKHIQRVINVKEVTKDTLEQMEDTLNELSEGMKPEEIHKALLQEAKENWEIHYLGFLNLYPDDIIDKLFVRFNIKKTRHLAEKVDKFAKEIREKSDLKGELETDIKAQRQNHKQPLEETSAQKKLNRKNQRLTDEVLKNS